jgi:STE24 endopeptidase
MLLLYTVRWGGEYFYVYATLLVLAINFLAVLIYPTFIQPCFNKVTPLPEGELRSAIEALAKRVNFPLTQLYEVDGSKRSAHSNAYFYGFCNNKRIVLFDTLIKQTNIEQVTAVLGHELGHWQMSHVYKNLVVLQVYILTTFFCFGRVPPLCWSPSLPSGCAVACRLSHPTPASFCGLWLLVPASLHRDPFGHLHHESL